MQFKLFTATIAAMAAGSAIAGPVPAVENNNGIAARNEQATQQTDAALAQNKVQMQQQLQSIHSAQQALGKQVPNDAQLQQIKQQVATAQQTHGANWNSWGYWDDCYDYNYWDWWSIYFNFYGNCWTGCGYSWNTCNNYWW